MMRHDTSMANDRGCPSQHGTREPCATQVHRKTLLFLFVCFPLVCMILKARWEDFIGT